VKPTPPAAGKQGGSGMETLLNMIGEEVYRVVMFAVFVAQVRGLGCALTETNLQ
jgi:hypothetical protein